MGLAQIRSSELDQHNIEVAQNLAFWERKPLLREIYKGFHREIASYLRPDPVGIAAELGSGIGNIKEVIPHCLRTDIFPNPWLDQVENAYRLSFANSSVAHLILFDVFHHLEYPGTALKEFQRVLKPGGRVIIFDPCMSLLGLLVYGVLHHEPIALRQPIKWEAGPEWSADSESYYAAQGNATRIFDPRWKEHEKYSKLLIDWHTVACIKRSALSYVLSGGYSKPQIYPTAMLPVVRIMDRVADYIPAVFATRMFVVLEKR